MQDWNYLSPSYKNAFYFPYPIEETYNLSSCFSL